MIAVVDACVIVDAVIGSPKQMIAASRTLEDLDSIIAPHILDLEVLQACRKALVRASIPARWFGDALTALEVLPVVRMDTHSLNARIAELRHNVTSYDAAYVALAEELGVPVVTCDRRLARSAGAQCEFVLV